jgi:phosphocarrier protein FPr
MEAGARAPAALAGGERVRLLANWSSAGDTARALEAGADGVGLYRTEFLFMGRSRPPGEDAQAAAYRAVIAAFGPERPVVIRLADIGGDKAIPYLDLPREPNPFLGVRGLRIAARHRGLLVTQLRAIARAAADAGAVPHVMAPMVTTLEDVELFRGLIREAGADPVVAGIMVEVPAAAYLAPELARVVDFFSIGTNDLTQYVLAADRTNPALADHQDALHPAVLRAVDQAVRGGRAAGIPVAVCGEAAGDPASALVLVGLGVDELSADPGALDTLRAHLAHVTRAELDDLAAAALAARNAPEVRALAAPLLARAAREPGPPPA